MFRLTAILLALLTASVATAAEAPAFSQTALLVPAGIRTLLPAPGGAVVMVDGDGRAFRVSVADGRLNLTPVKVPAFPAPGVDALPDTEVAVGGKGIEAAWLVGPTRRYGHGVLGDGVEAGGVAARLSGGWVVRFDLAENAVFEDRSPRLADMDGDGRDEILLVKSYLDAGAALSVVGVKDGKLVMRAEAEPIGLPNRWLNPVGAADFDGDGRVEAAVVITPHIGGILTLYEMKDGRLVPEASLHGFSNHGMGSRELRLSTVADVDGDGNPDLIVPGASKRTLKVMSYADGRLRTLAAIANADRIEHAVLVGDLDGDGRPDLVYGLRGGVLVAVIWRR